MALRWYSDALRLAPAIRASSQSAPSKTSQSPQNAPSPTPCVLRQYGQFLNPLNMVWFVTAAFEPRHTSRRRPRPRRLPKEASPPPRRRGPMRRIFPNAQGLQLLASCCGCDFLRASMHAGRRRARARSTHACARSRSRTPECSVQLHGRCRLSEQCGRCCRQPSSSEH